jgi:Tfp pilus assembly protein PilF
VQKHAEDFFFGLFAFQFTPLAIPFVLVGLVVLYRRFERFFWPLFATAFFNIWFATNYLISDIEVFYIPTFLVAAVPLTLGLWQVARTSAVLFDRVGRGLSVLSPRLRHRGDVVVYGLIPILLVMINWYYNDRSRYYIARDYGINVLNTVRGSATLLTQGWITPYILGYLKLAERQRDLPIEEVRVIIEGKQRVFERIVSGRIKLPEGLHLYTTVPLEIKGTREAWSEIKGLVYEIGLQDHPVLPEDREFWGLYSIRDVDVFDKSVFADLQTRSLQAKYAYLRGEYYFEQGEIEKALAECQKAVELAPNNKQVYNNLAAIYFKRGFLKLAEHACLRALEIDPGFQQARHNLGNIYFKMGEPEKALEQFDINRRMHWRVDFFRPLVAQIFMEQGEFAKAAREFENALLMDPTNIELFNSLGIAHLYAKDYTNARKAFENALNMDPNRAETNNNLGLYHDRTGQPKQAEEYFRRALEIEPDLIEACNNLGFLKANQQDYDTALHYFQRALEIDPAFTQALNNLGILYHVLEQPQKARDQWQRSIEINPNQPKIADYLLLLKEQVEATAAETPE